jgi:hypothetical protein
VSVSKRPSSPSLETRRSRVAQLGGVVEHRLEVELGHAGQPLPVALGLQVGLPGPLGRPRVRLPLLTSETVEVE